MFRAFDKAGLVALLKEHESATVLLDYTLFDFTDEDQLLIISGASHVDFYDDVAGVIPYDKMEAFFKAALDIEF